MSQPNQDFDIKPLIDSYLKTVKHEIRILNALALGSAVVIVSLCVIAINVVN